MRATTPVRQRLDPIHQIKWDIVFLIWISELSPAYPIAPAWRQRIKINWCRGGETLPRLIFFASKLLVFTNPVSTSLRNVVPQINTLNARKRAYQSFPRSRPNTVRASGEWTAVRHLIGYPSTNRITPTPLAQRIPFFSHCLRAWVSCNLQLTSRIHLF